jgi:DNA modification methylase
MTATLLFPADEAPRFKVRQATQPGELVVDPFLGSGSTGEAALLEGRRFAGCELDEHQARIAYGRLDDIASRPERIEKAVDAAFNNLAPLRRANGMGE